MQGIDDQNCGVDCIAGVHPIVANRDPNRATGDIAEAVLILIEVVGPRVSHADAFVHLTKMHVHIRELCWQDVQAEEVMIVLLEPGEAVGDNAHYVVDEVTHIKEPIIFHEDHVPCEMSERVHEHCELIVRNLL